jgi:hypothetical protein
MSSSSQRALDDLEWRLERYLPVIPEIQQAKALSPLDRTLLNGSRGELVAFIEGNDPATSFASAASRSRVSLLTSWLHSRKSATNGTPGNGSTP